MTKIEKNQDDLKSAFQSLYIGCKINEENLHAASEQMQNRGLKSLFKRFAQQHRQFARAISHLAGQMNITLTEPKRLRNTLQRGWSDIRTGMIVGRANRQQDMARQSNENMQKLLAVYDRELQHVLPEYARIELLQQRQQLQRIQQWLERIADQKRWLVRLYDDAAQADEATQELKNSGFATAQINVDPLGDLRFYQDDAEERAHSTVDAVLTGALLGAIVGLLVGLTVGYLIPIFSQEIVASEAVIWSSLLRSGLIGLAVGASFFSLFGFLLGQGISEDDASLAQDIAEGDGVVISVQTTPANYTDAARILQMWHERHVETIPA